METEHSRISPKLPVLMAATPAVKNSGRWRLPGWIMTMTVAWICWSRIIAIGVRATTRFVAAWQGSREPTAHLFHLRSIFFLSTITPGSDFLLLFNWLKSLENFWLKDGGWQSQITMATGMLPLPPPKKMPIGKTNV